MTCYSVDCQQLILSCKTLHFILLPQGSAKYCYEYMSFCLSACITRKLQGRTLPDFCVGLWFGLYLAALRYTARMYFRFCGWHHVFT